MTQAQAFDTPSLEPLPSLTEYCVTEADRAAQRAEDATAAAVAADEVVPGIPVVSLLDDSDPNPNGSEPMASPSFRRAGSGDLNVESVMGFGFKNSFPKVQYPLGEFGLRDDQYEIQGPCDFVHVVETQREDVAKADEINVDIAEKPDGSKPGESREHVVSLDMPKMVFTFDFSHFPHEEQREIVSSSIAQIQDAAPGCLGSCLQSLLETKKTKVELLAALGQKREKVQEAIPDFAFAAVI